MKKANGYFKPAYTDPHHYPDDVVAPIVVVVSRHSTRYIPDVEQHLQHVADAPSSSNSFASLSSSLLWPLSSSQNHQTKTSPTQYTSNSSPNSYIRTKLNDDYHIGNKINVMPQLTIKAQQKYFVDQNEHGRDGGDDDGTSDGNEKRTTKQTRKIGEDYKLNYAVCLRVIYKFFKGESIKFEIGCIRGVWRLT